MRDPRARVPPIRRAPVGFGFQARAVGCRLDASRCRRSHARTQRGVAVRGHAIGAAARHGQEGPAEELRLRTVELEIFAPLPSTRLGGRAPTRGSIPAAVCSAFPAPPSAFDRSSEEGRAAAARVPAARGPHPRQSL